MQKQTNKGFTLVELAIVLVIIGLLIGGILKGQQLMQNSRITATVAQIKAIEAATTNFYDVYKEKPGDLQNPDTRIKDCTICTGLTETGNGKVGTIGWDLTFQSTPFEGVAPVDTVGAETVLFWYELNKTGLIGGVTDEGITGTFSAGGEGPNELTFGGTLPEAKAGGGFWVGNLDGTGTAGTFATFGKDSNFGIRGTVLRWVSKPNPASAGVAGFGVYNATDTSLQALNPAAAANVDRKLDDGLPASGNIESYGGDAVAGIGTGNCMDDAANLYQESTAGNDCGLIIRIFK